MPARTPDGSLSTHQNFGSDEGSRNSFRARGARLSQSTRPFFHWIIVILPAPNGSGLIHTQNSSLLFPTSDRPVTPVK